jgi:hypothetical protein
MTWNLETAISGTAERLAPILMTAFGHRLGLLPLAIGSGDPGRKIEGAWQRLFEEDLLLPRLSTLSFPQHLGVELQFAALRHLSNVGGAAIFAAVFANL